MAVQRGRHVVLQPPTKAHTATVAQRAVHPHAAAGRLPHVRASGAEQLRHCYCELFHLCLLGFVCSCTDGVLTNLITDI